MIVVVVFLKEGRVQIWSSLASFTHQGAIQLAPSWSEILPNQPDVHQCGERLASRILLVVGKQSLAASHRNRHKRLRLPLLSAFKQKNIPLTLKPPTACHSSSAKMDPGFDPTDVDLTTADPAQVICALAASQNHYNGGLGARVSAIFIIGIVSTVATFFPVLAARVRWMRINIYVYLFARYFGAGVIVATAFIQYVFILLFLSFPLPLPSQTSLTYLLVSSIHPTQKLVLKHV